MNCFPVPNGSIRKDSTKSWVWRGYYNLHLLQITEKKTRILVVLSNYIQSDKIIFAT